jgi:SAM-dependent methyltransferase
LSAPFDAYKDTYREAVQDSIAFSGLELEFFTERKVSHLLRVARTHLGPPSSLRVADIGCGIGLSDGLLAPQVGELHGVDMARGALATAAHDNPLVHYHHLEGERLPFEDGALDLAFAINVLHHVPPPDRPRLVAEMARIVRPGGLVAIYEHNPLNPLTRWAVSRCAFDADAVLLGRRELARLARGAGLELVMQSYIVFFPSRAPLFSTIERGLGWLPLGAQHGMAARK